MLEIKVSKANHLGEHMLFWAVIEEPAHTAPKFIFTSVHGIDMKQGQRAADESSALTKEGKQGWNTFCRQWCYSHIKLRRHKACFQFALAAKHFMCCQLSKQTLYFTLYKTRTKTDFAKGGQVHLILWIEAGTQEAGNLCCNLKKHLDSQAYIQGWSCTCG